MIGAAWQTCQAAHYKLFVLTGQSNSLGNTGGGEADPSPGSDPADSQIRFYWHNRVDATTSLGDSGGVFTSLQSQQGGYYSGNATHWGPEIAFGRTLYRAGVRDFGIIKASRGGGGNTYWSKSAGGHMYSHVVSTVNAATASLTANGDTFEIAGFLYVQGESDSSAEAAEAGTRFKALVDNLRADLPNAASMHAVIGGIAAAGATRDIVRANQTSIADSTAYIDSFSNIGLQPKLYDSLHFNKAAKITVGERFAQSFFSAGIVSRHYGKLTFIGDSITQGGNGDHPGYRYTVFKHLADKGVPINAAAGYKFTGSVTGPSPVSSLTAPDVNGQVFENIHDGHFGWRAFWMNGRVALPNNRRDANRGEGTLLNWTGQASPQEYSLDSLANKVAYPDPGASGTGNTGTTYVPDTVSIMAGINDLGDNNNSANQVVADLGTMIDQLRAANPSVRVHLNRLLHTNQTLAMKSAVDAVNGQLDALAAAKNAASSSSPVWVVDADTGFDPVAMTYDNVHPNSVGEAYVGDRIAASLGLLETPEAAASASGPPPHVETDSSAFTPRFEGNEIWNGAAFANSWAQTGTLTKTLPAATDLNVVNPGGGGAWIEGTNAGWNTANNGSWTLETRIKFNANANGFMLWLGTDNDTILVEIYGDRTQDSGGNTFNVAHNNLDGNFHSFRVVNDAANGKYHVWRDAARLTPVAGVAYDNTNNESRLIMGDYTSASFGNNFDATIDYVRFDQTGACLPPGADADGDGLRDAWEYQYFGSITAAGAGSDEDGDGKTNLQEQAAGTDPWAVNAAAKTLRVFVLTGGANALGMPGTTDASMRFPAPGAHPAEQTGGMPFFWNNRADGTPAGDAALGDSGGAWVVSGPQTGGYYAGNDEHWGPEIGFARMLWNAGYRDFAIVKAAAGGGGNTLWQKGSADDHMYQHLLATVNAAVTILPPGYDNHEIAGLLYVQGEGNDATEAADAGNRFSTLLANLKTDLPHAASLVGVFGEIAASGANRDTTRTNQLALANSRADIGYAESNGLLVHNQDGLSQHYDAESQILLGERMAAEIIATSGFPAKPLPAWSNLHAWYVADNGMTYDSSSAVNRWAALQNGGAVRDLTRRVSGLTFQRAVTAGNGESRKVMRFDGTNDLWSNATTEFGAISGARSVAFLCRTISGNNGYLFDGSTGTGRTRAQVRGGNWQAGVGTAWDEADSNTAAAVSGEWHQHVFTFSNGVSNTTVKHWIDGVLAATTTDTGTANMGGFIVGSNGGSPFVRLAVDVAEIAVYNTALGETEITALKSAWDARWGTPALPPFSATVAQTPRAIPRFGRHQVLNLELNSRTAGATTLSEIRVRLSPGSRALVSRWALHSSGTSPAFNPSSTPLAVVESPASDTLVFPLSATLAEGTNLFWLAAEPLRYAALGSTIDAEVLDLTTTGAEAGTVVPANANPAGALTLALVPLFNDVRSSGEGGVNTYRIPGITCDSDGVLHSVYDHRYAGGGDLPANIDVGYSRSTDGGATWSPSRVILDFDSTVSGSSGNGVGDPCILHDPVTDTLWAAGLWSFGNHAYSGSGAGTDPTQTGQYVLTKSTDGGATWSAPINITVPVKDDTNWRLVFQGPGHGFAMRNGTLVFPSQRINASGVVQSCSVFSTDHGATWDFGSAVTATSPQTNENTACELDDGRLLFSMRTPSGSNGQRAWAHYTPGGANPMRDGSWNSLYRLAAVPDPVCQGSVIQWTSKHRGDPKEFVVFGNPASSSSRVNFTLRASADAGSTWPVSRSLYSGASAYSSICVLPDKSIGVLFEKDSYTRITFARVEADWLLDPSADADGDGMPDPWETLHQLNPALNDSLADPDGDGADNRSEYAAGTDPRSAASVLRSISLTSVPGGWRFSWQAVPGMTYAIETSADLANWQASDEVFADSTSMATTVPTNGPALFIRARTLR